VEESALRKINQTAAVTLLVPSSVRLKTRRQYEMLIPDCGSLPDNGTIPIELGQAHR